MKNAIWSAIPNLSVVVSGDPVAMVMSLATQIGSSYMSYRREKANAISSKEEAEITLQTAAIEQFDGLKLELFTTAWRLADEYDFDDEWRLTEKQINQYNKILMDTDEYRKYARLEAISERFIAYPPFWYFFGHTANYIAEAARMRLAENKQETDELKSKYEKDAATFGTYREKAKGHFEHYFKLCQNNILREDQLTASFALEYSDLLCEESLEENREKIIKLIGLAEKMAPLSFDILQLCVVAYLNVNLELGTLELSKTNLPSTIVVTSLEIGKALSRYARGDIDGPECLTELGEKGTGMLAASAGAAVGQVLIPIPVVGGLIGSMAGYAMSSAYYNSLVSVLNEAKIAHEERLRIEAECAASIAAIKEYQLEIELVVNNYLRENIEVFSNAFTEMELAYNTGDVDSFIGGTNSIVWQLGGVPLFETQAEFDKLMKSDIAFEL